MSAPKALIVLSTVPDRKTARRIARDLVEQKLAACVNQIGPIRSVYRWQGKLYDDPEYLLLIKTTRARAKALEKRIQKIHPYVLPEVIFATVSGGSGRYLNWIASATR